MPETTKIYGPPGTGKTTRLITILDQEIDRGTQPDRVAYLTHTNAAADVVAERADAKVDRRWFRTIHSACVKRLGLSKENIVDPIDYSAFSRRSGLKITSERDDGLTDDSLYYAPENFAPVLRAYDLSRLTGISLDEVCATQPTHPSLQRARRETFIERWEDYKSRNGLFDFTDMLQKYADSDIDPLPCDVVFVDEAQDLSNLQWRVLNKLAANAERVYLAGDDDQAIYGFMGGSEFGFFDAAAAREEVLRTSFRVPLAIGERAERIIRLVQRRREKEVEWRPIEGKIMHVGLGVANLPWRAWIDAGKSVLVLARHRRGALDASTDLSQIAVPHALGGYSVHNSTEAKAVRDYILMRRGERLPWRRAVKVFELAGMVEFYEDIRSRGVQERDLTIGRDDPIVRWRHWDDPEWPLLFAQSGRDLKRIQHIQNMISREGLDIVGRDPHVNVMTMHASKGREADIVVIIPDCNETVRRNLNQPSEIRLAYVALTRAKERAIILAPHSARWINHLTGA